MTANVKGDNMHTKIFSKKKVNLGNDQEKTQSEGNSHSKNRNGKYILILRKHIVSRMNKNKTEIL